MMTRVLAALIFSCILSSARSEPRTWLMQGDILPDDEIISRFVQLDTHKAYFPISTRAEVYFTARQGKLISCVIAAAVHQNGQVSVVEGGYKTKKVRIRYTTENGRPDVFFVFVQAARTEPVSIEGNIAESARLGIAYEPIRNWTLEEIQDALSNTTAGFLSS